jgi:hypothetical protein
MKHTQILKTEADPTILSITSDAMADVCLRYLAQPCYQCPLKKFGDTFMNFAGEDIMEHHLLSYAAKYWDKHLDDVLYTPQLCQKVTRFIMSPQFQTCLQVQSLFVGGRHCFYGKIL